MAPIKFEENIREKLQERELQPSKDSWNKLAGSLEREMPRKNRGRIWMAVAAGLIGILLAVTILFNPKEDKITEQLVEDNTEENIKDESLQETPLLQDVLKEEVMQDIADVERMEEINTTDEKKELVVKNESQEAVAAIENENKVFINEEVIKAEQDVPVVSETEINEAVAINKKDKNGLLIKEPLKNEEELFIENKIDAVVADIQNMQKNNTVTVEEIDALLAKAQRDIATNRILNSGSNKIDATALLQDVETELERSFRNRVFEALGDGFNKVRTAVVERNN